MAACRCRSRAGGWASTLVPEPGRRGAPGAGVPAPVKGLSLVSFFNDVASDMVYPLLPAFLTRSLGAGAAVLGVLDGAADLTAAAVKWWSGTRADRPGWRRPLILGGYATAILVRPLVAVASAAWQVVGFRVIDRIGKGIRTPARDALIADLTPPPLHGRAFGFHRAADHAGAVVGALLAWWFLRQGTDPRDVIGWSVAPGLLAFAVLWVVLRGHGERPSAPDGRTATLARDATGRVFWFPVAALALLALARLPEALLLLRLQDLGVPVATVPLAWAGLHVVRASVSYPGGWLADHLGTRATVAAGGLVFTGVALALAAALQPALAVVTFLTLGLVAGLMESSERALVAELAPVRTGRGFGAYHAMVGLAALPAGGLFGWIYQQAGGPAALRVSAAAMGAGVLAWLAARR